jgi:hypothetical protein
MDDASEKGCHRGGGVPYSNSTVIKTPAGSPHQTQSLQRDLDTFFLLAKGWWCGVSEIHFTSRDSEREGQISKFQLTFGDAPRAPPLPSRMPNPEFRLPPCDSPSPLSLPCDFPSSLYFFPSPNSGFQHSLLPLVLGPDPRVHNS